MTLTKFQSFNLPKERGWVWNPTEGKSPLPGDFYELGTRTNYKHVGVILDIDTILWTTVEGGQGGPSSGFDAIKRKGPQMMPSPLLGWINIEEFYQGWGG
jgi:hypothetical protein